MPTQLVPAREIVVGDVLCNAYAKLPRTVTTIRPVTTTLAGRPRVKPPVQVTIESTDPDGELYSDTVYSGSLVRVLCP